jgi:hypothetical protein
MPQCLRIVQSTGVTDIEELFQTNDFDMEDSIVCMQWIHDGHTEIVFMATTVEEFIEIIFQTAD